ncbi:MAG: hypothetical protein GKB99_03530 [Methanocellales archaeon]|nr:hypothetical protein [Methanocellales archaeon]
MKWEIVLILVLSLPTIKLSGCVEDEPVMPTQPIAPRVEATPTPMPKPAPAPPVTSMLTPTKPQETSQPEQIKISVRLPGIKCMCLVDVLEK